MSRYYDDYVEHSWGTDPKQKAKEKAYNAAYYAQHKDEILARQAKNNAKKADKAKFEYGTRLIGVGDHAGKTLKKADKAKFEYGTRSIGVGDHAGKTLKKANKAKFEYGTRSIGVGDHAGKTLKKAKKNLSKSLNPEPTVTLGDPFVTGTNGVPTKKSKSKASKKKKK